MCSPRLLRHAQDALNSKWQTDRDDEMPTDLVESGMTLFREQTLALPTSIDAELAKIRTLSDKFGLAREQGDGHSLVTLMDEEGYDPLPVIVGDAKVFESLFQRSVPAQVAAGNTISRNTRQPVLSGSTLTFPVGAFKLSNSTQAWKKGHGHGKDITIVGKGMNHTLIVLEQDFYSRVGIHNLTISDCTLFTDNNYFLILELSPPVSADFA